MYASSEQCDFNFFSKIEFKYSDCLEIFSIAVALLYSRQCSHETEAHKKMHLICIAARNDAVFFAYLVATPLHRFKCKKAFSTR